MLMLHVWQRQIQVMELWWPFGHCICTARCDTVDDWTRINQTVALDRIVLTEWWFINVLIFKKF